MRRASAHGGTEVTAVTASATTRLSFWPSLPPDWTMSSSPSSPTRPLDSCFTDRAAEELIDADLVLRALARPRRREVLGLLDERPEWPFDELAERLVNVQAEPATASLVDIETSLIHTHLPTLVRADLVDFVRPSGPVRRGGSYDVVRAMAEAAAAVAAER